jgi:uncharacterized OsmC-like protein
VTKLTKLYANAKLVKDFRINVDNRRSHSVCLDQPLDMGSDLGPSALELAIMSLAGCYVTIFKMTADKMRLKLKDIEVDIEAIKSEELDTITETKFDITINSDAPRDRIERMHELTLKNCPVGKIFDKAGVKSTYNIKTTKD